MALTDAATASRTSRRVCHILSHSLVFLTHAYRFWWIWSVPGFAASVSHLRINSCTRFHAHDSQSRRERLSGKLLANVVQRRQTYWCYRKRGKGSMSCRLAQRCGALEHDDLSTHSRPRHRCASLAPHPREPAHLRARAHAGQGLGHTA